MIDLKTGLVFVEKLDSGSWDREVRWGRKDLYSFVDLDKEKSVD